jgi:hypothetical protein
MRERANTAGEMSRSALSLIPPPNGGFQGLPTLAEVQNWAAKRTNEPPGGVRGKAPALPAFERLSRRVCASRLTATGGSIIWPVSEPMAA